MWEFCNSLRKEEGGAGADHVSKSFCTKMLRARRYLNPGWYRLMSQTMDGLGQGWSQWNLLVGLTAMALTRGVHTMLNPHDASLYPAVGAAIAANFGAGAHARHRALLNQKYTAFSP